MSTSIHILGVCGTLMAGVARLAKELGYKVSGSDQVLAPPMSDQLHALGIDLDENMQSLPQHVDTILTGNILSRGQPIVEKLLNQGYHYLSAPDWLYQNILYSRPVIAVAGTHGKTTTASMIAWILEKNGKNSGFLIGGVAENFGVSSRLGDKNSPFVIEADEYDTAFFDKRPKFLHYHPDFLLINNLEFDHADIYADLSAIQTQFHYLLRQLPSAAKVIYPQNDHAISEVIQRGCWSEQIMLDYSDTESSEAHDNGAWQFHNHEDKVISIIYKQKKVATGKVSLIGEHNRRNILAAVATCEQLGISAQQSLEALQTFKGVKRRLEVKGEWKITTNSNKNFTTHVRLIDDFAHHPTAIAFTLKTLKNEFSRNAQACNKDEKLIEEKSHQLIALLDITSTSMRQGVHKHLLGESLACADEIFIWENERVEWDVAKYLKVSWLSPKIHVYQSIDDLLEGVLVYLQQATHSIDMVMLSNGHFAGLSAKLISSIVQTFCTKNYDVQ